MVEIVHTLPNYKRNIVSPTCAQKLSGTKTSKIMMTLHYSKALLDNVFDRQKQLYIDTIFLTFTKIFYMSTNLFFIDQENKIGLSAKIIFLIHKLIIKITSTSLSIRRVATDNSSICVDI